MDVKSLLAAYVKSITFESNFNREFTIKDPFGEKPEAKGPGAADMGNALRPRIYIELEGMDPLDYAPYGKPDPEVRETYLKRIKVSAVAVGGAFAALLYRAFAPRRK